RRRITRTVEGYDAADPKRASTLALRAEWTARDDGEHGRIEGGYGALVDYLAAECRDHGASIVLGAEVVAIEGTPGRIAVRCEDGRVFDADAVLLAVPLPLLAQIALPASAARRAAAATDIGVGNVVKFLLRFRRKWWTDHGRQD